MTPEEHLEYATAFMQGVQASEAKLQFTFEASQAAIGWLATQYARFDPQRSNIGIFRSNDSATLQVLIIEVNETGIRAAMTDVTPDGMLIPHDSDYVADSLFDTREDVASGLIKKVENALVQSSNGEYNARPAQLRALAKGLNRLIISWSNEHHSCEDCAILSVFDSDEDVTLVIKQPQGSIVLLSAHKDGGLQLRQSKRSFEEVRAILELCEFEYIMRENGLS